jgi:AcrR family transcriptional regulator
MDTDDEKLGYRKHPQQARAIAKRDRILDAAQALIHRKGFGTVTVAEIARDANVAKPTVYQIFKDKEAILAALVDRKAAASDAAYVTAVASSQGKDWREINRAVLTAFYHLYRDDPTLHAVFVAGESVHAIRERGIAQTAQRSKVAAMAMASYIPLKYEPSLDFVSACFGLCIATIARNAALVEDVGGKGLLEEAIVMIEARIDRLIETDRGRLS